MPDTLAVDHDAPPWDGPVLMIQTAAGGGYEAMLAATEAHHRAYCAANRVDYHAWIGIRRGVHAWQASFNRVEMLADLLEQGFAGWVLYLDADAVIRQPGFDIRRYLGKRGGFALIAAPGGAGHWNINDGVFFLNLGHEAGRAIVRNWRDSAHANLSDEMLQAAVAPWQPLPDGRPFPDDQHLLQMLLMRDETLARTLLVEKGGLLNLAAGRFICQFMRVDGAVDDRLALIREAVATAERECVAAIVLP